MDVVRQLFDRLLGPDAVNALAPSPPHSTYTARVMIWQPVSQRLLGNASLDRAVAPSGRTFSRPPEPTRRTGVRHPERRPPGTRGRPPRLRGRRGDPRPGPHPRPPGRVPAVGQQARPVGLAATATVNLAAFLWQNRQSLGPAFSAVGDLVESALAGPRPEIQRVGTLLVSVRDDQTHVLGLLHQQTTRLDGIADAVAGVARGQAVLAHSLAALQHLSFVTLGLNAVAPLILLHQFRLLGRQLTALGASVRRVQGLIEAQHLGQLETGLSQLQQGVEEIEGGAAGQGRATLNAKAANNLTLSVNTYAVLLDGELRAARPDPAVARVLFRHLAVGLLGEAGCHLALGNTPLARQAIQKRSSLLDAYARAVFARTIGDDAVRYFCPGMARHGVTVESLAELYRQAGHAGAVEGRTTVGAVELIEEWRGKLHTARDPFRASRLEAMRADLAEVVAAVEEVNRVKSFAAAVGHFAAAGTPFAQVMARVRAEIECARLADAALAADTNFVYLHAPG